MYGSKDITDSGSGECVSDPSSASQDKDYDAYRHIPLTEEVLSKHNQEMQIQFMELQKKNASIPPIPLKDRDRHLYNKAKHRSSRSQRHAAKVDHNLRIVSF